MARNDRPVHFVWCGRRDPPMITDGPAVWKLGGRCVQAFAGEALVEEEEADGRTESRGVRQQRPDAHLAVVVVSHATNQSGTWCASKTWTVNERPEQRPGDGARDRERHATGRATHRGGGGRRPSAIERLAAARIGRAVRGRARTARPRAQASSARTVGATPATSAAASSVDADLTRRAPGRRRRSGVRSRASAGECVTSS